jgi:hypothetical protein
LETDGALERVAPAEGAFDLLGREEGTADKDGAADTVGETGPEELGLGVAAGLAVVGSRVMTGLRVEGVGVAGTKVGKRVNCNDGNGLKVGKRVWKERLPLLLMPLDLLFPFRFIPFPPFPLPPLR